MRNKEKYDLRKLKFMFMYNSYYFICGVSIIYENEYIAKILCDRDNPIIAIMKWLEMDEENDREEI